MYSDESYVIEALRAGAKAYVLKDSSAEDLQHAINEVIKGKHYLGSLRWSPKTGQVVKIEFCS
jgi:DNA-binding NarL/FixJ family response regulator